MAPKASQNGARGGLAFPPVFGLGGSWEGLGGVLGGLGYKGLPSPPWMPNFGRVLEAKLAQVGPKLGPKIIKNHRKIDQKSSKNLLKSRLRPQEAPRPPQDPPKTSQDLSKPKNRSNLHPPGSLLGGLFGHVGFQEPPEGHSKYIQNFD